MVRPREFDEGAVLDAAMLHFWAQGYEATSIKDLVECTGVTAASLYNAFGDKRAIYQKTLDRYIESSVAERLRRCDALPPREAIGTFFRDIVSRSLGDRDRKGCMLVNAALDVAPHDPGFRKAVAEVLGRIEEFFLRSIRNGQADGTITRALPARILAQHLLSVLVGVRVLARVRSEATLLEGAVQGALSLLQGEVLGDRAR